MPVPEQEDVLRLLWTEYGPIMQLIQDGAGLSRKKPETGDEHSFGVLLLKLA